jgi:hypothetical protein
MKIKHLGFSAFLLVAGFCLDCSRSTDGATRFSSLLSRLPADSDLVLIADLSEASQKVQRLLEFIQNLPIVKENEGVKQAYQMGRAQLDMGLNAIRSQFGLDPLKDLLLAAVGIVLREEEEPRLVLVVSGNIPADLPAKLFSKAEEETRGAVKLSKGQGAEAAILDGPMLVFSMGAPLELASGSHRPVEKLMQRHRGLSSPLTDGFIAEISLDVPAWLKKKIKEESPEVVRGLLSSFSHVDFEFGKSMKITVDCEDTKGAEKVGYALEGLREIFQASASAMRGYGWIIPTLDLRTVAADLPSPFNTVFDNEELVVRTLKEILPDSSGSSKVQRSGQTISLIFPNNSFSGFIPVAGILAAVAIPAFIEYTRNARADLDHGEDPEKTTVDKTSPESVR